MADSNFKLSATFVPGGWDDFYMPEVVSPSPQRVMPEMSNNIQDNLEALELDAESAPRPRPLGDSARHGSESHQGARGASPALPPLPVKQQQQQQQDTRPVMQTSRSLDGSYGQRPYQQQQYREPTPPPPLPKTYSPPQQYQRNPTPPQQLARQYEEPNFSPFPRLPSRLPNVPPTDDEKEHRLESSRVAVLQSNDPDTQLEWAQDALSYVEISLSYMERIKTGQNRPMTPQLEHQLRTDALNVVNFLADQHHPRAEFMRGMWLEFGKFGIRQDKKEAFRSYARAAERGYWRAEYRMGMQYEQSNEPLKAIKHYNTGAQNGDSASNYRLGMMTLLGQHGQKQDYARGSHLIRLAAQSADENAPQGAYVLGMLLARELPDIDIPELFLPLDVNQSRQMIEKAAYLGFSRAQLKMGTAYELCQLNCEFNPALSLHYYALASRQGEAEADMAISKWFLCGHDGVFDKNEDLAFTYAERAAKAGLATAEFALGYFHEIGMHVPVDFKEAQRWYAKAAEHGNKDASGRIEGISRSKTLSRRDHEGNVSKIRAQHGSRRVGRQNTIREEEDLPPVPKLPSQVAPQVPEIRHDRHEELDMPDPSNGQEYYQRLAHGIKKPSTPFFVPPQDQPGQQGLGPGRRVSPGNSPYLGAQAPIQRPGSAAPYPLNDDFGMRPPVDRPYSVAGYNNNNNPRLTPGGRGGSDPLARPFSVAGDTSPNHPPLGRGAGRGAPPGAPRPFSVTLDDRPTQRPQPPRDDSRTPYPGFEADPSTVAPKKRQNKIQKAAEKPVAPRIQQDANAKPGPGGLRTDSRPPAANVAPADAPGARPASHAPATGGPPSKQPLRQNSPPRRPQQQQQQYQQDSPPRRPQQQYKPDTIPTKQTQSMPTPPLSTGKPQAAQLPGKGPKTFEQMGIPTKKEEPDCVIM